MVEATAISTPLDKVPLYIVKPSKVATILLKSSQAVSSSGLFSLGTPAVLITRTRFSLKNANQNGGANNRREGKGVRLLKDDYIWLH